MAVSRRRPERGRRRESFLPQQNAQNTIDKNSEMNVYLHPGVCQPEREEAVDDLKESLKSANRQRVSHSCGGWSWGEIHQTY